MSVEKDEGVISYQIIIASLLSINQKDTHKYTQQNVND